MKAISISLLCLIYTAHLHSQKAVKTYYDPVSRTKIQEQYSIDVQGQKQGAYKGHDESGMVLLEYTFKDGLLQGECREYSNDEGKRRMIAKLNYSKGELDGLVDYYSYVCDITEDDPGFQSHADKEWFEGKWCLWMHTGHFTYEDGYKKPGEFWQIVEKEGYLIKEVSLQRSHSSMDFTKVSWTYVSTNKTRESRRTGPVFSGTSMDTVIIYDPAGIVTQMLLQHGNIEVGYMYGGLYPSGAVKCVAKYNRLHPMGSDGYTFSEGGCLLEADAVRYRMKFDTTCFHLGTDELVASGPEHEQLASELNYLSSLSSTGKLRGRPPQPCTWELYNSYKKDSTRSIKDNIADIELETLATEQKYAAEVMKQAEDRATAERVRLELEQQERVKGEKELAEIKAAVWNYEFKMYEDPLTEALRKAMINEYNFVGGPSERAAGMQTAFDAFNNLEKMRHKERIVFQEKFGSGGKLMDIAAEINYAAAVRE